MSFARAHAAWKTGHSTWEVTSRLEWPAGVPRPWDAILVEPQQIPKGFGVNAKHTAKVYTAKTKPLVYMLNTKKHQYAYTPKLAIGGSRTEKRPVATPGISRKATAHRPSH